jgi:hypothetical protein
MLAAASMVHVTISLSWQLFVVRQQVARQSRIEFVRTGVGLALFGLGCSFGLTGAAAARVAEALFTVALYRPHIERMTETRLRDFLPIYRRSAILTLHAIAPACLVMALHGWSPQAPLDQVLAATACGAGLWLGAIIIQDHRLAGEIRRFGLRLRPRLWNG